RGLRGDGGRGGALDQHGQAPGRQMGKQRRRGFPDGAFFEAPEQGAGGGPGGHAGRQFNGAGRRPAAAFWGRLTGMGGAASVLAPETPPLVERPRSGTPRRNPAVRTRPAAPEGADREL